MMNLETALNTIGNGGNTNYFTLKNHGDTETVRFLYGTDPEKLDWFPVYRVEINGKKRYVRMPEQGEPDPFPKYGHKPTLRAMLQLVKVDPVTGLTVDNAEVFAWDRGKTHIQQLAMIMAQIGGKNLCDVPIVITRVGQAGSQQTSYQMMPRLDLATILTTSHAKRDDWCVDEKSFVLKLSYDDMVKVCEGTYVPQQKQKNTPNFGQGNNTPKFNNSLPPVGGENNSPLGENQAGNNRTVF